MGYTWERFLSSYSLKVARMWQWAGGDAGADGTGYGASSIESATLPDRKTIKN